LKSIDLWSLRGGKHRMLFKIDKKKKKVLIITIGHRKDVYHRLKKGR
jgi:mRNA-degrading endonuclease RelE of RelBE toxin-antitoxin system